MARLLALRNVLVAATCKVW